MPIGYNKELGISAAMTWYIEEKIIGSLAHIYHIPPEVARLIKKAMGE